MLKIFSFLISFFIFISVVDADRIYSDNYYFRGDNDVEFPLIDDSRYVINTYQSNVKLDESADRVLLSETPYIYKTFGVRYIVLNGFTFINSTYLREVEIYNNNEKINYTYRCSMCGTMRDSLNNGIYYENVDSPMYASFTMLIDLETYYNPDFLSFDFSFACPKSEKINVKYKLWMLREKPNEFLSITNYDDAIIYRNDLFVSDVEKDDLYKKFNFHLEEKDIKNRVYENIFVSDLYYDNSFYELVSGKIYIYQDKLYLYYREIFDKVVLEKINDFNDAVISKDNNYDYNESVYVINDNECSDCNSEFNNNENLSLPIIDKINSDLNTVEKENNLSDNTYFVKTYYDIKLPILCVIFFMLISVMVYAIYVLKKES